MRGELAADERADVLKEVAVAERCEREIVACTMVASWAALLKGVPRQLRWRGLKGARLMASNAHRGRFWATQEVFRGTSCHPYRAHVLREPCSAHCCRSGPRRRSWRRWPSCACTGL